MPAPAEIKSMILSFDRSQSERFQHCEKCHDGWIQVFEGKSMGGNQVSPKIGAAKRCECWFAWIDYKNAPGGQPKLVREKHEQPAT